MNILIDNAGFVNKGAELMLRSIITKSEERFPHRKCVITPHSIGGIYSKPIGEGLYIYQKHKLFSFIPKRYLRKLFFVKPSEIDILLDAGGFQFSDQWLGSYSKKSNQRLEEYYRTLKSNGAKLVFLPQAFGPFTHPLSIERIKIVYKYADIIFAREKVSYKYLINLFGESDKIILKPDFTNLLKPVVPLSYFIENRKYVCVVPNRKMITDTKKDVSSKYISYMADLCQFFIDKGEDLVLLNHEGKGDADVILEIQSRLTKPVVILDNLDALEVKSIIGKMKMLISSRFHGVVSGLSQGVCTFTTGWSHKYPELLADYGVGENLLDIHDLESSKYKINKALMDTNSIYHVKADVIRKNEDETKEMWNLVWKP